MSWFSRKKDKEPEHEVLDEDEFLEELSDEELYVDDIPLESAVISFCPKDLSHFDTDMFLENLEQLPYEFRCYYDTRKAFSRAVESLREEMNFESYEGGKSVEYSADYEFDDHEIEIVFTLSRDSDNSPLRFCADIRVDES